MPMCGEIKHYMELHKHMIYNAHIQGPEILTKNLIQQKKNIAFFLQHMQFWYAIMLRPSIYSY